MKIKAKHYRNLTFSREQASELAKRFLKLCAWAQEARVNGFLSLEDQCHREQNEFLAIHLQDICDGMEPELLKRKMKNHTKADALKGVERIARVIEIEGLLYIQAGINPRQMLGFLYAYLPPMARRIVNLRLESLADPAYPSLRTVLLSECSIATSEPYQIATLRDYVRLHRGYRRDVIASSDSQVLARVLFESPRRFRQSIVSRLREDRIEQILNLFHNIPGEQIRESKAAAHLIFQQEMARWLNK
jgi:hypothetical protein